MTRPGGPAASLPRLPSFATQSLVNGVFEAVSDSRDITLTLTLTLSLTLTLLP